VCVCVYVCVCVCVCVGGGLVMCGCFGNIYTVLVTEVFLSLTEVFLTLTGFSMLFPQL